MSSVTPERLRALAAECEQPTFEPLVTQRPTEGADEASVMLSIAVQTWADLLQEIADASYIIGDERCTQAYRDAELESRSTAVGELQTVLDTVKTCITTPTARALHELINVEDQSIVERLDKMTHYLEKRSQQQMKSDRQDPRDATATEVLHDVDIAQLDISEAGLKKQLSLTATAWDSLRTASGEGGAGDAPSLAATYKQLLQHTNSVGYTASSLSQGPTALPSSAKGPGVIVIPAPDVDTLNGYISAAISAARKPHVRRRSEGSSGTRKRRASNRDMSYRPRGSRLPKTITEDDNIPRWRGSADEVERLNSTYRPDRRAPKGVLGELLRNMSDGRTASESSRACQDTAGDSEEP